MTRFALENETAFEAAFNAESDVAEHGELLFDGAGDERPFLEFEGAESEGEGSEATAFELENVADFNFEADEHELERVFAWGSEEEAGRGGRRGSGRKLRRSGFGKHRWPHPPHLKWPLRGPRPGWPFAIPQGPIITNSQPRCDEPGAGSGGSGGVTWGDPDSVAVADPGDVAALEPDPTGLGLGRDEGYPAVQDRDTASAECTAYGKGEVAKSRTSRGHLPTDVMDHARGLLIADFGVDHSSPKNQVARSQKLAQWVARVAGEA